MQYGKYNVVLNDELEYSAEFDSDSGVVRSS